VNNVTISENCVMLSRSNRINFVAQNGLNYCFIQIIEGKAEIMIDGELKRLSTGDGIIIPAHKSNSINANERFKMISTVIKSGYE